jgi:hypothetical protein
MKNKKKNQDIATVLSNIPLDSSLGHLALGDIAFVAWRKVKKDLNKDNKENKSNKKEEK